MEEIKIDFIYDRTQADVDYVKRLHDKGWKNLTQEERTAWLLGLKGCLNRNDLERIEKAIHELGILLGEEVTDRKDSLPEIPDTDYFANLLQNVSVLRQHKEYLYRETPRVPPQPLNTYQKVNDVERILHDIHRIFWDNKQAVYYCGTELYGGDALI